MAYTEQTWTDGVSAANAARLTHIEDGIFNAAATADLAAPLASPTFTGTPAAPDPTTTQGLATKAYVDNKAVAGVVLNRTTDATGSTNNVLSSGPVDDVLVVPVPASGTVDIDFTLIYSGNSSDNIVVQVLGPTGATCYGWGSGPGSSATSNTGQNRNEFTIQAFGLNMVFGVPVTGNASNARGSVTVTTTGTSGNVTFQYARSTNTSAAAGSGTAAKLLTGSSVRSVRLA